MSNVKRVSVFNDDFAKKYPVLNKHNKFSSEVHCWKYHSTLNTEYGGVRKWCWTIFKY